MPLPEGLYAVAVSRYSSNGWVAAGFIVDRNARFMRGGLYHSRQAFPKASLKPSPEVMKAVSLVVGVGRSVRPVTNEMAGRIGGVILCR